MPDVLICSLDALDFAKAKAENVSAQFLLYLVAALSNAPILEGNRFYKSHNFWLDDRAAVEAIQNESEAFLQSHNLSDYEQLYDYFRIRPEAFIVEIGRGDFEKVSMSRFYATARSVHHDACGVGYVYEGRNQVVTWPGIGDGIQIYLIAPQNASGFDTPYGWFSFYDRGFIVELQRPLIEYSHDAAIKVRSSRRRSAQL